MIVRPLSNSPDMGSAIKYARSRYLSLAKGARPRVDTTPYQGASDLLLIRTVLGLTEAADIIYILDLTLDAQEFLFVTNKWNVVNTGTLGPIYLDDPESTSPHAARNMVPTDTGTVIVVGGRSGLPITLVSATPAVCSITPFVVTYADLVADAPNWTDPSDLDLIHPSMTIQGFTVTLNAYGDTSFTLSQAGNGLYLPVEVFSGPWTFTSEPLLLDVVIPMEGGACAGGEMPVEFFGELVVPGEGGACAGGSHLITQEINPPLAGGACAGGTMASFGSFDFAMSGGACAGGEMPAERSYDFALTGGACAGGSHIAATLNVTTPKPVALQFGPVMVPYTQRIDYPMPLAANTARNGVLTYRITARGPNCTVSSTGYFSGIGTWYGTTSFAYVAIETKNSIAVESLPVTIQVTIQAPLVAPTVDFFDISTSYIGRTSLGVISLLSHIHPGRSGSIVVQITGHSPEITVTLTGIGFTVTFPQAWKDGYWINYRVLETKDGVTLQSNLANINIWVAKPVLPQADFSTLIPSHLGEGGLPWKVGELAQFTCLSPVVGEDGEALTLFWAVYEQPGPNLAYPDPDNGAVAEFTPLDAGAYAIGLNISDSHDQVHGAVKYFEVESNLPAPEIAYPVFGAVSMSAVASHSSRHLNLVTGVVRKRNGSLEFEIMEGSPHLAVVLEEDYGWPTGCAFITPAAGLTQFPQLATFKYRVKETANDVTIASKVATATVQINAPQQLAITVTATKVSWSGGKPPYKLTMSGGGYSGVPSALLSILGNWVSQTSVTFAKGSWCYSPSGAIGSFFVEDSANPSAQVSASMAPISIPQCVEEPPPPDPNALKVTVMGYHWLRVSGGTLPYSYSIAGQVSGITLDRQFNDIRTWGTGCYCPGAGVKISDAAGTSITTLFGANWVTHPVCISGCLPPDDEPGDSGWEMVWTCPSKDVRTNTTYMNSGTLVAKQTDAGCVWSFPGDAPRVTLVSPDGQWRITGDYAASSYVSFTTYGCTIFQMNLATGLNFGPASFPFCPDAPNSGANAFLVRTLERRAA